MWRERDAGSECFSFCEGWMRIFLYAGWELRRSERTVGVQRSVSSSVSSVTLLQVCLWVILVLVLFLFVDSAAEQPQRKHQMIVRGECVRNVKW